MPSLREIEIGPIEQQSRDGLRRISATVAGHSVWFESREADLVPSAEAFANLFLVPALHHKVPIRLHARLCPVWKQNSQEPGKLMQTWWDYASHVPIYDAGPASLPPPKRDRVQCFSGGCDSFYSLLRSPHAAQCMVFVQGFDFHHRDGYRMRRVRKSLEAIAAATGRKLFTIRTNLRRHPLFSSISWERTHGGALAAIGHLLSRHVGSLLIPSSYAAEEWYPVGTHWLIDKYFSSSNLEVIHDEPGYRLDKLRKMANEPLVQQHLRVCWQNFAAAGNCSYCDKCVRTMIVLAGCGQLQNYPVFNREMPLAEILDRMEPIPENVRYRYAHLIEQGVPSDVEAAIRRLLERKQPRGLSRLRRAYRKMRNKVLLLAG